MKITFTHLNTQKTPKTSDSLKPTPNKGRDTEKKPDRSVLSSPLGQDLVRCTNDDLIRLTMGGQEIVETTCENSYIHFKLAVRGQSCPHL